MHSYDAKALTILNIVKQHVTTTLNCDGCSQAAKVNFPRIQNIIQPIGKPSFQLLEMNPLNQSKNIKIMPEKIIFHVMFLTYCQAMRLLQFTLCRSNCCKCLFLETYNSMHKANTRIQTLKLRYQNASARELEHKAHIPDIQLSEFTSPLGAFSKDRSGTMFAKVVCSISLDLIVLPTTCGHCN